MKKKVVIVWNDFYHPKEVIEPALKKLFTEDYWDIVKTESARELLETDLKADLAVFYTNGRTEGETDLTYEEQSVIVNKVKNGMGILFYHAGLVMIEKDSPFYKELNSGRFIHHPEQCEVTVSPIKNASHPITKDIIPFTQKDEHYFCQVDVTHTNLLACATSGHMTAASVWCHDFGSGRVAGISQGHTLEMQNDEHMLILTANTIKWLVKEL
ncbi:MAG: ThuA domain-containing protein [Anaerocolumna sp.]